MVLVVTQLFLTVHTVEILKTGILVQSLLELVSREGRSFVLNLRFEGSILVRTGYKMFGLGNYVENEGLVVLAERDHNYAGLADVNGKVALFGR